MSSLSRLGQLSCMRALCIIVMHNQAHATARDTLVNQALLLLLKDNCCIQFCCCCCCCCCCSVPLMMVVGGPVAVQQTHPSDPGFAAAVDDAHARLVDAMQSEFMCHEYSIDSFLEVTFCMCWPLAAACPLPMHIVGNRGRYLMTRRHADSNRRPCRVCCSCLLLLQGCMTSTRQSTFGRTRQCFSEDEKLFVSTL
jgi:hypothetical protein